MIDVALQSLAEPLGDAEGGAVFGIDQADDAIFVQDVERMIQRRPGADRRLPRRDRARSAPHPLGTTPGIHPPPGRQPGTAERASPIPRRPLEASRGQTASCGFPLAAPGVATQQSAVALQQSAVALQQSAVASQQNVVALQHYAVAPQQSIVATQQSAVALQQSRVALQQSRVALQQSAVATQQSAVATQTSSCL